MNLSTVLKGLRQIALSFFLISPPLSALAANWEVLQSFNMNGEEVTVLYDTDSIRSQGDIVSYWRWIRSISTDKLWQDGQGETEQNHMRLDCRAMYQIEIATRITGSSGARIVSRDAAYSERTKSYFNPGTNGYSMAEKICQRARTNTAPLSTPSPTQTTQQENPCREAYQRSQPNQERKSQLIRQCEQRAKQGSDALDAYQLAQLIRHEFMLAHMGNSARTPQFEAEDVSSFREANEWLEKSANLGLLQAQVELGRLHTAERPDSEKHLREATSLQVGIRWLETAASRGDPEAQQILGDLFLKGRGVEQNLEKSLGLLTKSARQQNSSASNSISVIYLSLGSELADAVAEAWHEYYVLLQSRNDVGRLFASISPTMWQLARAIRQRPPLAADAKQLAAKLLPEIQRGQFNDLGLPTSLVDLLRILRPRLDDPAVRKRLVM